MEIKGLTNKEGVVHKIVGANCEQFKKDASFVRLNIMLTEVSPSLRLLEHVD